MRFSVLISTLAIGFATSDSALAIRCNLFGFQKWMASTLHYYNAKHFNLKNCQAFDRNHYSCALTTTNDHCIPEKNPCSREVYVQDDPLEKIVATDYREAARCTMRCAITNNETMLKCWS